MRARPALIGGILVALVLASPACRFQGLAFREDDRLTIVAPLDREELVFPVTVRWDVQDIPEVRSFVVVVDRSPQPPGEGLDYFVRDEIRCRKDALQSCLKRGYLADRHVYHTTKSEITFKVLAARNGVSKSEENRHEVTVALLDDAGRRIGEAGWTVTFTARIA